MFNFCFHKYKYVYEKEKESFLDGNCEVLKKRFRICQKCDKAQELKYCFICEPFLDWVTLNECETGILLNNITDCGNYYLLKETNKKNMGEKRIMVKKFRKKPIVIEAVQWTGNNYYEIYEFTQGNCYLVINVCDNAKLYIKTLEGDMRAKEGDYIIKGKFGEFYVCKEEVFKETYEEV